MNTKSFSAIAELIMFIVMTLGAGTSSTYLIVARSCGERASFWRVGG
jgi:hypothetical protein